VSSTATNRKPRNLRGFLEDLAAAHPESIMRVREPVALDYEMTALAMELESRGQSPVLWFERVADSPFPVVANVFGTRQRAAFAIGVPESELLAAWGRLGDKLYPPELVKSGPILDTVLTGADVDLTRLPIPRHFAEDGGPYITNGIVIGKNPDNGVRNASFHRMQLYRKDAIFQDIVPGISDEHTLLLAFPQEARLLRTLRQHNPNVTAVAYPKSGTCRFHAYVAVRNPAEGQARNIGITTLSDDLSLKLVVVVDDDVDVTKDFDVLWAMATRMQADSDMDLIRNAMGAVLDPSNRAGTTAKLIIDATRKTTPFAKRHSLPQEAMGKAQALLAGYKRPG
jgi:3-polyprenyl-4-hydroxybenzoate decarboxylase